MQISFLPLICTHGFDVFGSWSLLRIFLRQKKSNMSDGWLLKERKNHRLINYLDHSQDQLNKVLGVGVGDFLVKNCVRVVVQNVIVAMEDVLSHLHPERNDAAKGPDIRCSGVFLKILDHFWPHVGWDPRTIPLVVGALSLHGQHPRHAKVCDLPRDYVLLLVLAPNCYPQDVVRLEVVVEDLRTSAMEVVEGARQVIHYPPDIPLFFRFGELFRRCVHCPHIGVLQNDAKYAILHIVVVVLDDLFVIHLLQDLDLTLCCVLFSVDHLLDGEVLASLLGQVDVAKVARTQKVLDLVVFVR